MRQAFIFLLPLQNETKALPTCREAGSDVFCSALVSAQHLGLVHFVAGS